MRTLALLLVLNSVATVSVRADEGLEKGTIRFDLKDDQKNVPERYRLEPHSFEYEMKLLRTVPKIDVYHVTFPSPVLTDCKENNTVHAEYYRPKKTVPSRPSWCSTSRAATRRCRGPSRRRWRRTISALYSSKWLTTA